MLFYQVTNLSLFSLILSNDYWNRKEFDFTTETIGGIGKIETIGGIGKKAMKLVFSTTREI